MRLLILFAMLLPAVAHAQPVPNTPDESQGGKATQPAPHPSRYGVWHRDLRSICPYAKRSQIEVRHPFRPDEMVTLEVYVPSRRPMVREYPHKVVFDYGCHEVDVHYHSRGLTIDYDGPRYHPGRVGFYFGFGFD